MGKKTNIDQYRFVKADKTAAAAMRYAPLGDCIRGIINVTSGRIHSGRCSLTDRVRTAIYKNRLTTIMQLLKYCIKIVVKYNY